MAGEGFDKVSALMDAGFSDDEVHGFIGERRDSLTGAGFTPSEVDDYFGIKPFDEKPVQEHVDRNLENFAKTLQPQPAPNADGTPGAEPEGPALTRAKELLSTQEGASAPQLPPPINTDGRPREAATFKDALEAGFQISVQGLLERGKMPDVDVSDSAEWYMTIAKGVGMVAGDLPTILPTAAAYAPGGPVVAGAAAMAAPAALREMLMQKYQNGEVTSFKDFWTRSSTIFLKTVKAGLVGGLTGGAGAAADAATAGSTPLVQTSAKLASEIGMLVGVGKGLEGEMPTMKDLGDASLLIVGLHGAGALVPQLGEIYAKTGIKPGDVAEHALADPIFRQELLAKGGGVPEAYKTFIDPEAAKTSVDVKMPKELGGGKMTVNELPPANMGDVFSSKEAPPEEPVGPKGVATAKQNAFAFIGEEKGSAAAPEAKKEIERSEAEKKILSMIGTVKKEGIIDKIRNTSWNEVYADAIDKYHPIGVWRDAITGGKDLPENQDPYILARLTAGNSGRAVQAIENSPFEQKTLKNISDVKPLQKIFEPIADDMDGWRAYAISKRLLYKESQGIKVFGDTPEAKAAIEAAPEVIKQGAAKYEGITQDVVKYRKWLLGYMKDAGIFSDEQLKGFFKGEPDYAAPFYRVLEGDTKAGGIDVGKEFGAKNPIRQLKGSELLLVDPVESLARDTFKMMDLAERNHVFRSTVRLAEKYGAPEELFKKVDTPVKAIDIKPEELQRFQNEFGVGGDVAGQMMTIFRPMRMETAPNQISGLIDGKRVTYEVPEALARSMKDMDATSAGLVMKILAGPVKTLKAGTSVLPEFAIRHLVRGQLAAFIYSDNGYVPAVDYAKGAKSVFSSDETFQNWLKGGGSSAAFVSGDRDAINENVMRLEATNSIAKKAWNYVGTPLQLAQMMSELSDSATRVGEMGRALEGKEPTKRAIIAGAYASREVFQDYARMGAKIQAANMISAYMNDKIQGLDRLGRALVDSPAATAAKLAVAITAPSLLLWAANRNDPRYQEIPNWEKDQFWHVMTHDWKAAGEQEARAAGLGVFSRQNADGTYAVDHGIIFRVPKPQAAGVFFGSSFERGMDLIYGKPEAGKGFMDTMRDAVVPPLVPNLAVPFTEVYNNKSTFTGAPIVPQHLANAAPEVQYTPYTSETAKALGRIIPSIPFGTLRTDSPMVIDNLIRDWSGGFGKYSLEVADKGLQLAGIAVPPPKPTATYADTPIVKAFVTRFPSANSQSLVDFHDNYQKHVELMNTIQIQANRGNGEALTKLMTAKENVPNLADLGGMNASISEMHRVVELVMADTKNYKPDEKRQIIDGLYFGMINIARQGNEIMRKLHENINGGKSK